MNTKVVIGIVSFFVWLGLLGLFDSIFGIDGLWGTILVFLICPFLAINFYGYAMSYIEKCYANDGSGAVGFSSEVSRNKKLNPRKNRNRKQYNGVVDVKLNNEYQIETQNNQYFPSVMAYLELIDKAWESGMSEEEAALYIATLYYCGLVKNGHFLLAQSVYGRIIPVANFCVQRGIVSEERWHKFNSAITNARSEAGVV
jgi:hypothetical protein